MHHGNRVGAGRAARTLVAARMLMAALIGAGLLLAAGCASSGSEGGPQPQPAASETKIQAQTTKPNGEKDHTITVGKVLRSIVFYAPNRVFDLLDLVRLRVRVGPGLAVSARATEPASLTVGSYATLWAGLPGPRQRPTIPLPLGVEGYSGMEASVADVGQTQGAAPNYSFTEVGAGFHLLLFGVDIGVDPWEAVDFVAGFIVLDPRHDDF